MSGSKRGHLNFKTPVAILEHLQSVLNEHDYHDVQECVFEYDRHQKKTQEDHKKHCSDAFLYTKSCAMIFSELHSALFTHCEYMHALNRLLDISRFVEQTMAKSITARHYSIGGSVADDNDEKMDIDGDMVVEQPQSEVLQKGIAAIVKRTQKLIREDRDEIANTNSQLRFSLRYKTFSRILHLARGTDEGCRYEVLESEKGDRHAKSPDFLVDSVVKTSNAYETLKNQCMLGAVLRYTERNKKRFQDEKCQTTVGGAHADTTARVVGIERILVQKATTMLQATHCQQAMKSKVSDALDKTKHENMLLQDELDSVILRLEQIKK